MEKQIVKNPVMIYTEQTPNPETLKFVTNRMLYKGTADFKDADTAKEWSPFAASLFSQPYVKGIYFCNNYVTVSKEFNFAWEDIMLRLKEDIKKYVESEEMIVKEGFAEAIEKFEEEKSDIEYSEDEKEIVKKIKDLIETYVKPAVEMDGGNIEFKSFIKGIVTVELQGACSGCPSSTQTLKGGIEGMMKRMIPEVTEVVAEMG
jgi:Fe-S cluster biogenesis protein NfuA